MSEAFGVHRTGDSPGQTGVPGQKSPGVKQKVRTEEGRGTPSPPHHCVKAGLEACVRGESPPRTLDWHLGQGGECLLGRDRLRASNYEGMREAD